MTEFDYTLLLVSMTDSIFSISDLFFLKCLTAELKVMVKGHG